MKFTKLEQLAEGKTRGTASDIRFARAYFNTFEDKMNTILEQAKGDTFRALLKQYKFPATENKALIDALKKAQGELEDLQMAVITALEMEDDDLTEEAKNVDGKTIDIDTQEDMIRKELRSMESKLPHECRYKFFDTVQNKKQVLWYTQESSDEQGKAAARKIASELRKAGLKGLGWTVLVTIRDNMRNDVAATKWQGKTKV